MNNNLNIKIDELELSIRVMSGLKTNGINTIGDLVKLTESEFLRTPNFGRKSLNEIREVLSGMSLKLGMTEKELGKDIPKNLPNLWKEFNMDIISKSREAVEKSLKHITDKEEATYDEMVTAFKQHRKFINFYEKTVLEVFDQMET
tara:strand:- start:95 stop:532 length:438 start_codon:yes stop_codon:yes gene_type:complete